MAKTQDEPIAGSNTGATLLSGIERMISLQAEIDDVKDQMKSEMDALKNTGFDTKIIRKVIARSRREPTDLAEEESLIAVYEASIEQAKADRQKDDAASAAKAKTKSVKDL